MAGYFEAAVVDVADCDAGALEGGKLGGDLSYAAGADNEDSFADLGVGVADGIEGDGGHSVDGGFTLVDFLGEFDEEGIIGDDDVVEMAAGALADEYDVISLEVLGVGAGLNDAADGLVAGGHGEEAVAGGVVAFKELVAFGAVGYAGVEGFDFDLVGVGWGGRGPVGDEDFFADFGVLVSDYDCSHELLVLLARFGSGQGGLLVGTANTFLEPRRATEGHGEHLFCPRRIHFLGGAGDGIISGETAGSLLVKFLIGLEFGSQSW